MRGPLKEMIESLGTPIHMTLIYLGIMLVIMSKIYLMAMDDDGLVNESTFTKLVGFGLKVKLYILIIYQQFKWQLMKIKAYGTI
jgi:hypothetical protein